MIMTTQQIRFFLEAASRLNFSEAARRLYVSQSTLSKQIALMEEELNVKLFSRSNRTISLTPAGSMLYRELDKMEKDLMGVIEQARFIEQGTNGRLSIGILEMADPSSCITPLINTLQEKHPRLDVNIKFLSFSEIRNALESGIIDVAFTKEFDARIISGLQGIDIKKNMPAVLMPKNHPLSLEPHICISQLKEESFVVLSAAESRASAHSLTDLCEKYEFFPKIVKCAESNLDRIYYIQLGYGISIVDSDIPLPRWADLVTIPIKTESSEDFIGINLRLTWLEHCPNPSLRLLIDLVNK